MAQGDKPKYTVMGRVNGDNKTWVRVGAAWDADTRGGVPYISVQLQAIPLNWDGKLALHENREEDGA